VNESIPQPLVILHGDGVGLACAADGSLQAEETQGLFAGDTRLLSSYRFTVAGHGWRLLARRRLGPATVQWDLQNPKMRAFGNDLSQGCLHARIRRRVFGALHDDLRVTSFLDRPIPIRLALLIDTDFADLFEVKDRTTPPRLGSHRFANGPRVTLDYQRGDFRRGLEVDFEASQGDPLFVGSQIVFDVILAPHEPWTCCVEAVPVVDGRRIELRGDPHAAEPIEPAPSLTIDSGERLARPLRQGCLDLDRLFVAPGEGSRFITGGAPWFLALFGRDALVTSLMMGLLGARMARGSLAALAATQAREIDAFRDAEPGKIAHELRRGELAHRGRIPHTPYYGSHDAPALYVLALWNAHRWTGDRTLLEAYLPAAEAALRWCSDRGDLDGDGLLEYRSQSPMGYRNQGWKDAGDAIVDLDGRDAELPIATVELQGYWFAALLAMAELEEVSGASGRADELRAAATALRARVEERFWIEDEGCYAMALDGSKRPVRSIGSNPGHLLWCGLPDRDRARRTAERLLAPDLFSGYGIRTLAASHRAYNPLSYQRGSVWPHDTALLAAGLARYGLHDEAERVVDGLLDAAACFEDSQLPELFCGLPREDGPPVPYELANVPQAWAAAVPALLAQSMLGIVPDVPRGCCYVSPWLPSSLPHLELRGIEIGSGELAISLRRDGESTRIERADHPHLRILEGVPVAPLWGAPLE
jgi:glycogen debranching enzyme